MNLKKKKGGGSNWMDTYGDMVTLLLCFFVLLYSISTVTEDKWIALVQSFNPKATPTVTATTGNEGPTADENEDPGQPPITQEQVEQQMEDLFKQLQSYVNEQGIQNNISVTKGPGYVFVSFDQTVFFDGDVYTLRPESYPVLEAVSGMLRSVAPSIDEIQILGHTAQGNPRRPNEDTFDRFLASNRATVVTVEIQKNIKDVLNPGRIVSVGYGQHRPIGDNQDSEGRKPNRRVEMIVAGKNVNSEFGDSIKQYYSLRDGTSPLS